MNSAGDRGSVFIEKKKGHVKKQQAPITSRPHGGLWEGWDGVGGPPSPLSSWDPWGITGTNKSL